MTTSGTYSNFLDNADVVLEAFDRNGIRPADIDRQKMFSCRRSINLELSEWSIKGINLWGVYLYTIPLVQGVSTYSLPATTIDVMDVYRREFQLSNTLTGALYSTVSGSPTVTVNQENHGLTAGQFINQQTPIAVGGILVSGYFQVASVIDTNNFTITAATNATSTVTLGGQTALFTSVNGSTLMQVNLPNHGLVAGAYFNVPLSTTIAGITLSGSYQVASVADANDFYITAPYNANASSSVYMNNGVFQMTASSILSDPVDTYMTPMSRTDYAMQSDKFTQAPPTTYWFNRTTPSPVITLWQVPDGSGPYLLSLYMLRQLQDFNLSGSQTADIPYRFQEALCAGLAKRLSLKFAPDRFERLKGEAAEAYALAGLQDRERVDLNLTPDCSGYYRGT